MNKGQRGESLRDYYMRKPLWYLGNEKWRVIILPDQKKAAILQNTDERQITSVTQNFLG